MAHDRAVNAHDALCAALHAALATLFGVTREEDMTDRDLRCVQLMRAAIANAHEVDDGIYLLEKERIAVLVALEKIASDRTIFELDEDGEGWDLESLASWHESNVNTARFALERAKTYVAAALATAEGEN
jgi:hypothetical protein